MAPKHPRTTEGLIDQLAKRVEQLQNALARGPILPSYTSATLPASPPTGLEVLVTDLGLRAYWNGSAWIYPPQRIGSQTLAAPGTITIPVPAAAAAAFSTLRVTWAGAGTTAGTATYMCLRLNGDSSTSSYVWQFNQASGTAQSSIGSSGTAAQIQIGTLAGAGGTAGYLGSGEFTIPNPGGSAYKAPAGISNSSNSPTGTFSGSYGGQWLSTAAVASITLLALSGSLTAGSTATVYGS
jgi:hypothetical protein